MMNLMDQFRRNAVRVGMKAGLEREYGGMLRVW